MHRDTARNRKTVRMVSHAAELIAALDAGFDNGVERLAAVAPSRVHLKIAMIVGEGRTAELLVAQRGDHLRAAQKMAAQVVSLLDVALLPTVGDRVLHRRRRSRRQ